MAMLCVINNQACQKEFPMVCQSSGTTLCGVSQTQGPPRAQSSHPLLAAVFFCCKSLADLKAWLFYVLWPSCFLYAQCTKTKFK